MAMGFGRACRILTDSRWFWPTAHACYCCYPHPKYKKQTRRQLRRVIKQKDHKEFRDISEEVFVCDCN